MDLNALKDSLKYSTLTGQCLGTEEALILYNTLLVLQNENHFNKVFFWGRIDATHRNYYIAWGCRNIARLNYSVDVQTGLQHCIYYYSLDCQNWGLLPTPTQQTIRLTQCCTAKFQGDPAVALDVLVEGSVGPRKKNLEPDFLKKMGQRKAVKLKEENRLAATVHMINEDACILPRGALFRRSDGLVVENRMFSGLNALEAKEYNSFLHYRKPHFSWNSNLLLREDFNSALDFLDPLDTDAPISSTDSSSNGGWMMNFDEGDSWVVLKSLHWPGVAFTHHIGTPDFVWTYFGDGLKCMDVAFMVNGILP